MQSYYHFFPAPVLWWHVYHILCKAEQSNSLDANKKYLWEEQILKVLQQPHTSTKEKTWIFCISLLQFLFCQYERQLGVKVRRIGFVLKAALGKIHARTGKCLSKANKYDMPVFSFPLFKKIKVIFQTILKLMQKHREFDRSPTNKNPSTQDLV